MTGTDTELKTVATEAYKEGQQHERVALLRSVREVLTDNVVSGRLSLSETMRLHGQLLREIGKETS